MAKKKTKVAKKKKQVQTSQQRPWDAAFKAFFSYKIMVESLLKSFLAQTILAGLDWASLKPWNNSHVTRAMKQRFNDCIWRVKTDKGLFYFYFMLEFQRKTDKLMAFRIAEYNSLLIRMLHKAKVITLDGDKPAVIPIVIYIGDSSWTAPLSIDDFAPQLPPEIHELQLQQKYILLNANRKTAGSQESLAALLFAICDSRPGDVDRLVRKLQALLKSDECENLRQLFVQMINFAILQPAGIDPVDPTINFQEASEMMAAKAQKWREEVLNEGILQGMGMPEAKAQKWRQEVLNEGILQGMGMPEAEAKKWREEVFNDGVSKGDKHGEKRGRTLERHEIALEMLKAGEPRARIIQYTRLTDEELDKLQ